MYRQVSSIYHGESLLVRVVAGFEPQGRWQLYEDACTCGWQSQLQVGLRIRQKMFDSDHLPSIIPDKCEMRVSTESHHV